MAYQMFCGNKAELQVWMEVSQVGPVSDAQALEWLQAKALMWSVMVRLWVLVYRSCKTPNTSGGI